MRVSVIGLGPMGRALAGALLDVGHDVTVHNRTEHRGAALRDRGAAWADTPAGAVETSDLTLVNVIDNTVVDAVVEQAGRAVRGAVLVGLASDTPERAQHTADHVAALGGRYLDGAIMTPIDTIGSSQASILFAGPRDAFDAYRTVFDALGATTWLGEKHSLAGGYDMALLDLFWSATAGFLHALELAAAAGIGPSELLPHANGIVEILPAIFADAASRVENDHHGDATSRLTSIATSLQHLESASASAGLEANALASLRRRVDAAVCDGHGHDEVTRISFRALSRSSY